MTALWPRLRQSWMWLELRIALLERAMGQITFSPTTEVDGLLNVGRARLKLRQLDEANRAYGEARRIAVAARYDLGMGRGALGLGVVANGLGQFDNAIAILEPEVSRFRSQSDPEWAANGFMNLGVANEKLGRLELAAAAYSDALHIASKTSDWFHQAWALRNLGHLAFGQKRYGEAEAHWKRALALYQSHRRLRLVGELQYWLAYSVGRLGRDDEAYALMAESVKSYERAGQKDLAKKVSDLLEPDSDPNDGQPM